MSEAQADEELPLPRRYRAALGAKGLLLLAIGLGMLGLAGLLALGTWPWPLRVVGALFFAYVGGFVCWASSLAFADVLGGRALRSRGAVALASRRMGYSLQLPSGRFLEFILTNPYAALTPGRRYTVTYGMRSGVIVAAPVEE